MQIIQREKLPQSQLKIILRAELKDLQKAESLVLRQAAPSVNLPGFRPGKVPPKLVKSQLEEDYLVREVVSTLLDLLASQAVKKEPVELVASPQLDLEKSQLEDLQKAAAEFVSLGKFAKDKVLWQIKFLFSLKPEVELGDYKKALAKIGRGKKVETAASLSEAEQKAKKEKEETVKKAAELGQKTPQELEQELEEKILNTLVDTITVDPPPTLIAQEVNQRLERLAAQAQKIGLTTEEYLKQKQLSLEGLHAAYKTEAEKTIKLRFIFPKLAQEFNRPLEKKEDFEYIMNKLKEITRGG